MSDWIPIRGAFPLGKHGHRCWRASSAKSAALKESSVIVPGVSFRSDAILLLAAPGKKQWRSADLMVNKVPSIESKTVLSWR